MTPLSAAERETIVSMNDEDDTAHVYSSQRRIITKLKKNPSAKLLREGKHAGSVISSVVRWINQLPVP